MKKFFSHRYSFVIFLILTALIAGCGTPNPAPKPTDASPVSTFEPTVPQRTVFPTQTNAPTDAPPLTTPTLSAQTLPTLTPIRATTTLTPTVIFSIAPGVYATAIRLVPAKPISGGDPITFYTTFVNTTGKPVTFKWRIKIWSPDDSRNAFGDTTILTSEIQAGTTELATSPPYKTNPGPCTPFYARVYNVNTDITADPIEFRKPDGTVGPRTDFQVCPP